MIYSFIKLVLKGTIRIFFRSVHISNANFIPSQGPLIILANHPSTFMDPIIIAAIVKRKIYFLGKGELFKGAIANWILPRLNIIPIYRKQDDPSQLNKNADTFKKCYEHLETGGVLLIFPEGLSITERKLKPIKPGSSHIALGAEVRNDFKLGLKIVNIGLNYENQHQFNRDVFINIHQPIKLSDYADKFKLDKTKTIKELTENIRQQLEEVVISIADLKTDLFVKNIETLYSTQLKNEKEIAIDLSGEFLITQNIVKAVNYFIETDPILVENIQLRIDAYFKNMERFKLKDELLSNSKSNLLRSSFLEIMSLLISFPIYLYGLINNILPFEIPSWFAVKIVKSRDFEGAIGMVLGIFTFLFFYSLQIFICQEIFHTTWLTLLYAISLPSSGFFTYYYWHKFEEIKARLKFNYLYKNKAEAIENLIAERQNIIQKFEQAKTKFLLSQSLEL